MARKPNKPLTGDDAPEQTTKLGRGEFFKGLKRAAQKDQPSEPDQEKR
jgi:hypothetical protein